LAEKLFLQTVLKKKGKINTWGCRRVSQERKISEKPWGSGARGFYVADHENPFKDVGNTFSGKMFGTTRGEDMMGEDGPSDLARRGIAKAYVLV